LGGVIDLSHSSADPLLPCYRRANAAIFGDRPCIPDTKERGRSVKFHIVFAGAVVAALACPLAAQAQGIPGGIAHGAQEGGQAAGPVGAVVGGAVGGVVGGVQGLLGIPPTYASYPVEGPRVYRHHRHWRRHTYRHVRHHPVS
jgi:hypothetical protein